MDTRRTDLKYLSPKDIVTDQRYQRPPKDRRVKQIINEFNPLLFEPINVSYRDGKYFAFTGQHRTLAAKGLGIDVPALVFTGLTPEDEARAFVANSQGTKRVMALHEHRALLFSGDPLAIEVNRALNKYGIAIKSGGSNGFTSVKFAYGFARTGVLERVCATIAASWRTGVGYAPQALSGAVFGGVGHFLQKFPHADDGRLVAALQKHSPADVDGLRNLKADKNTGKIIFEWYNGEKGAKLSW